MDEKLKNLLKEVRNERKQNQKCYSAQDSINIPNLLKRVIDTNFYKKDYNEVTLKLISKIVTYNDAIKALNKIIESKIFE